MTIIKIRKGLNGHKYSACDQNGNFIGNFDRISDVRKNWKVEIRYGQVQLARELDREPDTSRIDSAKACVESILRSFSQKGGCRHNG